MSELVPYAVSYSGRVIEEFGQPLQDLSSVLPTLGLGLMNTSTSDDAPVEPQSFVLSDRDWTAFMAALDDPAEPNEALKDLMNEFGPWKDSASR